jgi:hypothetical protein
LPARGVTKVGSKVSRVLPLPLREARVSRVLPLPLREGGRGRAFLVHFVVAFVVRCPIV